LSKQTVETLIDSGTGGLFINQNFAKNFYINYLDEPVKAYNIDRTENKWGTINAYESITLGKRKFKEQFYVTELGKQRIIFGYINTTQLLTKKREKLPLNPSKLTGDA
jgi:hypothetical protein